MTGYHIVFFSILLILLVWSLYYFWKDTDKYVENMQFIRKVYYVLFIAGIIAGMFMGEIKLEEWEKLLQFTALFVFIDLAVFQTPDVLKIWNTEFNQSNYIRKTIKKNEEVLSFNEKKVQNFTTVILKTKAYFDKKYQPTSWSQYKDELHSYLKEYTETFDFHVSIFGFEPNQDLTLLRKNLEGSFKKVELCYNNQIEDREWRNSLIDDLMDGKTITLEQKVEDKNPTLADMKRRPFVIVYYGENYYMLIGINSHNITVDGIDASHILNLTQIFEWTMDVGDTFEVQYVAKSEEDEV